ncbi:MAG: response regulator transcription factor [Akkermansiaceae bacterium]
MKILLADDDPLTLEALAACVEREGFQSLRANDGVEALALWRSESPDIVCLDIMMPNCNGYEVCKEIRESDADVPILFLSAKNEEADVVVGLDLGADDFIRKPFSRGEVMARIRATLRRSSAVKNETQFEMLDIEVFPLQLLARRGEERIDLTPREVNMLMLLYRCKGDVVSRDQFLDHCWGVDYFPDSRTLDQHILMLRKKIEREPGSPEIIQTVRGVGYRCPLG